MKARIKSNLDRSTQKTSPNSNITTFLEQGEEVEIVKAEYRKGNQLWYQLNDNKTWVSGAMLDIDYLADLPSADRKQMFICYRSLDFQNLPVINDIVRPGKELYFMPLPDKADSDTVIKVNRLDTIPFVGAVGGWAEEVLPKRKHVFIYIHGFDWQPTLKLDLPYLFMHGYFRHPENTIAKVLYFGWPSMGWRKRSDDRSIEAGEKFTEDNLFDYFTKLSEKLSSQGQTLNLIVHSFGLQLLNGMINPRPEHADKLPGKIFSNIFLMAPDITHLSVQKNGVKLKNRTKISGGRDYDYNLKGLKAIANKVHIYYNSGDYLLYVSTKKFNGKNESFLFSAKPDNDGVTTDYRTLGNVGKDIFERDALDLEPGFEFVDVQDLIKKAGTDQGDPMFYPFQNNKDFAEMKEEAKNGNYKRFDMLETFWKRHFFMTHHQYMFTCKPVVEDVLRRLDNLSPTPQPIPRPLDDLIV